MKTIMNQEIVLKAIDFAVKKHNSSDDPYRKGSKIPYIVHPIGVMNILFKECADTNVIIAGILHDTVEDTDTTLEEIEKEFGKEVKNLVDHASEPEHLKKQKDQKKNWQERKNHTINALKIADRNSKLVTCADKLDNIRSMDENIINHEHLWPKFNAPKEKIEWYYHSILDALKQGESIEDTKTFKFLKKTVERVFR
jgi:(p)ppGpp synthase/HD superfamily hydrolase